MGAAESHRSGLRRRDGSAPEPPEHDRSPRVAVLERHYDLVALIRNEGVVAPDRERPELVCPRYRRDSQPDASVAFCLEDDRPTNASEIRFLSRVADAGPLHRQWSVADGGGAELLAWEGDLL